MTFFSASTEGVRLCQSLMRPLENPGVANVIWEHEGDGGGLGIKSQQASQLSQDYLSH